MKRNLNCRDVGKSSWRLACALLTCVFAISVLACSGTTSNSGVNPSGASATSQKQGPSGEDTITPKPSSAPDASEGNDVRRRPEPPQRVKELAQLASSGWPTIDPHRMAIGQAGRIEKPIRVIQVVPLLIVDCNDVTFVLDGVSVAGVTDGKFVSIADHLVEVSGTTSYVNLLGGARTVFVVRTIPANTLSQVDELLKEEMAVRRQIEAKRLAEEEAARWKTWLLKDGSSITDCRVIGIVKSSIVLLRRDDGTRVVPLSNIDESSLALALADAEKCSANDAKTAEEAWRKDLQQQATRTWTSASGEFSVTATLISKRGDSVVLRKEDGTQLTVPLEKLSADDGEFVEQWQKRAR